MKKEVLFLFLLVLCLNATADTKRILSPDGKTYADIVFNDGRISYKAGYLEENKKDTLDVLLLEDSPLGLLTNEGDYSEGLELVNMGEPQQKDVNYELRQSKQRVLNKVYTQQIIELKNSKGSGFSIEFFVGNRNLAFRYHLQETSRHRRCVVVEKEQTGFKLPSFATAFICPDGEAMSGWERTKPSYEESYVLDEPVGKTSYNHAGYAFPSLFRVGEKGWILLGETGIDGFYCGSHLSDPSPNGLYTIAFPDVRENNGFGSSGAQFGLPGSTPWRTVTLSPQLKDIVETTVTWDVVEPLYEPSIDYRGGRATWSWMIWDDASINMEDQKTFIQLSADMGWEYCLVDNWWSSRIGHEGVEQLAAFARERGVSLMLWFNSNGGWSDAPQDPKNVMCSPIARKKEMKWMKEIGIKGIKVDFFGGDKQETIKLYEQILSDANEYGIQCIFHGCTIPRGWEKMYPNYCSSEAVLASENLKFDQSHCDKEALNACLLPFTRNALGSMDYGGTVLQRHISRNDDRGSLRKTSDIFELATAIAFQSSIQNFALTPKNLKELPSFELDFMRQIPTEWDETRFIDGYPGRYLILARRAGDKWYVAALNGQEEPLKVTVELPFLAEQTLVRLYDEQDQTPMQSSKKLNKKGSYTFSIAPQCAEILY